MVDMQARSLVRCTTHPMAIPTDQHRNLTGTGTAMAGGTVVEVPTIIARIREVRPEGTTVVEEGEEGRNMLLALAHMEMAHHLMAMAGRVTRADVEETGLSVDKEVTGEVTTTTTVAMIIVVATVAAEGMAVVVLVMADMVVAAVEMDMVEVRMVTAVVLEVVVAVTRHLEIAHIAEVVAMVHRGVEEEVGDTEVLYRRSYYSRIFILPVRIMHVAR
jgi:hypothetical protein